VFVLPFFIINCIKLRKRQKIALCGVFSLGLMTLAISLARFIVYTASDYNVDDASGSKYMFIPDVSYLNQDLTRHRPMVYSRDVYSKYRCVAPCTQSPDHTVHSYKYLRAQ
jgi:hypothetical protein